jgi:hypothetical protein
MIFLDCPAYLEEEGAVRCGLPAEVRCRFTMRSTDGPLESALIRCPAGQQFNGPIESLTCDGTDTHDPGPAGAASRAGGDSLQGSHDGRDSGGGLALPGFPAQPGQTVCRPNTVPAYYLGRPAWLWITVMRPYRRPAAASQPMQTATGGGEGTPSRHGAPAVAAAETACLAPATTSLPVMEAR